MTRLQFQDYLSCEPMISDLIDHLTDTPVDDFDNEWFISTLQRNIDSGGISVLMSPYGDFEVISSTIPNDHYNELMSEGCTIYPLT